MGRKSPSLKRIGPMPACGLLKNSFTSEQARMAWT